MITRISPTIEIVQLLTEIFINRQNKVTKISDESVLNAMFYGIAKVAQKAEKDIAITEARLFPENAYGQFLDEIAQRTGVPPRRGASGSSTFIRIFADPGTQYLRATNTFSGNNGIVFELDEDVTIPTIGYTYVKVRSTDTGERTNVDPLSISTVSPEPSGHDSVLNEYGATGGRDIEQDDVFRQRIKNNPNIVATQTIEYLSQLFQRTNGDILTVIKEGINNAGKQVLAIVTQNGEDLSPTELDDLLGNASDFLSISELRQLGETFGIELKNVDWFPIDIEFRVDLLNNFNPDDVRKNIQIAFSKAIDFRFWTPGSKVEWDDLLEIVKNIDGVRYVPDSFFSPNVDITIPEIQLPRFRGFIMRDLDGNIISDTQGVLNPLFYPNE